MLRERLGARYDLVGLYPLGGDGTAVKVHRSHMLNPAINFSSICFIDGDSKQQTATDDFIFRLPGGNPELTVCQNVMDNIDHNAAILTVSCQRAPERQKEVIHAIKQIMHTNRDPHLLFSQIGIAIGFVPEHVIRGAFLSIWTRENPEYARQIAAPVEQQLNEVAKHSL